MAMTRQVPPGRAGMLWLRRRLAVATRGADLLQQKLTILTTEEQRLQLLVRHTAQEWRETADRAERWLLRAALLGGQPAMRAAALPATAEAEPTWTTVMGVRYPGEPRCRMPDRPAEAAPLGNAALIEADRACRVAVPAAVRHAAATAALHRVRIEVAATRQRVRALERHWIPQLHESLAAAALQMEELDHGDAVRRRWATASSPTNRERPQ